MEDNLKEFLSSVFKPPKLNEVIEKLDEQGLQTLQDLKDSGTIELQQYGLTQFQIDKITRSLKTYEPQQNQQQTLQTPANTQIVNVQIYPPVPANEPTKDLMQSDKNVWDFVKSDKKIITEPEEEDEEVKETSNGLSLIHQLPTSKIISNEIKRQDQRLEEGLKKVGVQFEEISPIESKIIPQKQTCSVLTIFETYIDCGAEYRMEKIKLNETEYRLIIKELKQKKVQVVGFLGFFPSVIKHVQQYLGIKQIKIEKAINEGMILVMNEDKIALIFKTDSSVYDYTNPAKKSTNLVTTYTRFLIDLCEQIFIVPHPTFTLNPDLSSPYNEKMNPGFKLEQKIIKPDEKVTIKQIPLTDSKECLFSFNCLFSIDYSKYIHSIDITHRQDKEEIKHDFRISALQKVEFEQSMNIKKYSYREIQNILLDKWVHKKSYFSDEVEIRKFEKSIIPIVQKFIKEEHLYELSQYVAQLQDKYLDLYQKNRDQFEEKLKLQKIPLYNDLVKEFLKHNCDLFKKEVPEVQQQEEQKQIEEEKTITEIQPQNSSIWNKFVSKIFSNEKNKPENNKKNVCGRDCSPWISFYNQFKANPTLKYIDWEVLNDLVFKQFACETPWIHKTLQSDYLFNKIKQLSINCQKFNDKIATYRKETFQSLRTNALLNLFKFCESKLALQKQVESSLSIQFSQINVIRDKEHKIINWTLSKIPSRIYRQFQKVHSDSLFVVKDIFQIFDQSGLIHIQNYPLNKSSVYYFNISRKDQSMFTLNTTLSTKDTVLRIEPFRKQWFSYDNNEKRSNLGKLSKDGRIEDGAPIYVYDTRVEDCKIESIRDATFQPNEDSIIIIDQDYKLYQFRYQAKEFKLIVKKVNDGGESVKKIPILPSRSGDYYEQVSTTSDGKKIILKSKFFIDIYDLTWEKVFSLPISDKFQYFKTFTDKIHQFLIVVERDSSKCFQIVGLSESLALKQDLLKNDDDESDKILGNPIFDYIYQSFKKFGPHSHFLGCPFKTQLKVLANGTTLNKMNVERYFYQLKLQQVGLEFLTTEDLKGELVKPSESILTKRALLMILAGRLSIHVATIENFTLLPLQNGVNMNDQISDILVEHAGNSDLISKLLKLIKFGIFDSFIRSIKTQIHVISIVGRQSSGKSYALNRFFGTRFDVAATRCTDGIWMSCVEMYDDNEQPRVYIILDCEGLFSARRNEQEEMKLCLALSAVSDIMILNQDLSFNRYLNQLFNSFTKSIGRIKGKKLFKGHLMVLIRDIKDEAPAAYQELSANISQIQERRMDSFLTQVFNGTLYSQCLNYFEQPKFNEEIDMCRNKYFFILNQLRWANGNDFIESFKITLAQIYLDDDTDMDIHKLKIVCNTLYNEALSMFSKGGDNFKNESFQKNYQIQGKNYKVQMAHSDIVLINDHGKVKEEGDDKDDGEDKTLPVEILKDFIMQTLPFSQPIHNEWMKAHANFVNELLDQRQNIVINYFAKSVPDQNGEFEDIIKSYQIQLKSVTDNFILEVKRCSKTCKKCERLCTLNISHSKDCDCRTTHVCEQVCNITKHCQTHKYLCVQIFGHKGQHRCGQGNHKCSHTCGIKDCTHLCSLPTGHGRDQDHNCGNKHPCKQTCFNKNCSRSCQYDMVNPHTVHDCGEVKCTSQCDQCKRTCVFPHHFHDQYIREEKNEMLKYKDDKGKEIIMNYHNCGNNHECQKNCTQNGVCIVDYKAINKVWKNKFGEFEYIYFQPLSGTSKCKIQVPQFLQKHLRAHDCKIGVHRCKEQCPECKSLCNKPIGHDGYHDTKNHRNKEYNVFVSLKNLSKIEVEIEGSKRFFAPGESTAPENCTSSCQRKARAHYHIKECKGNTHCEAKINPRVQHATEKFYPFEDKIFDKWLCQDYWNSQNWEPPCDHETKKKNAQCNFICGHASHIDDYSFCLKEAWHEDAHTFECVHENTSFENIDICFCCDTTGSMHSYIENSKAAVSNIIKSVKENIKGTTSDVQFGFVAYRDHHESDGYVTKMQNLSNEAQIKSFIGTLDADGGLDGPEAVLDGLHDAIFKLRWRKKSQKYLFHIADAPPHGRQYQDGSGIGDSFPDGCPCGITIEKLADKMTELSIKYKLMKIGTYPNQMASIFKSKITDYEENDLDSAPQLVLKASEIIVRDIKCNELDFKI